MREIKNLEFSLHKSDKVQFLSKSHVKEKSVPNCENVQRISYTYLDILKPLVRVKSPFVQYIGLAIDSMSQRYDAD